MHLYQSSLHRNGFCQALVRVTPRITKHMIAPYHSPSEFADSSSMLFADHRRDRVVYRAFHLVFDDMKRVASLPESSSRPQRTDSNFSTNQNRTLQDWTMLGEESGRFRAQPCVSPGKSPCEERAKSPGAISRRPLAVNPLARHAPRAAP